jgi:hypothetical protein
MNNVHHCHTLHNDMSSDNVLLHFPPNSLDKVYIGICDWAMAGNFNDLKDSLYIHKSEDYAEQVVGRIRAKLILPLLGNRRDV